jgi:uncharacterized protein (DUF2141 family)
MTRIFLRYFCFALAAALTLKSVTAAELTIDITGIRNADGIVRMAIFDKEDQFPKGDKVTSRNVKAAKAIGGALSVTFDDLAPGRYAVAFHHDENENKKMDFEFFFLPAEGYGFSNDARVIFSAPTFEATSFELPKDKLKISVKLNY